MKVVIIFIKGVLTLIFAYLINEFIMAPIDFMLPFSVTSPVTFIIGMIMIILDFLISYILVNLLFHVIKKANN